MTKITPSVRLKIVTVHKLQDLSCKRYYYWRWIRNLEPRKINLNFWYGSVFHEGFETLVMTKNLNKAFVAMAKESKLRLKRYIVDNDTLLETELQMRLIKAVIRAASTQSFMRHLEMTWTERKFRMKLSHNVTFCSTPDGAGTYKGKPVMFEIKTAKSVNNNYFAALAMDQQIYGYGLQMKQAGEFINKVAYCVFRKSGKYLKKGQGVDEFVEEVTQDIAKRPEWYFIVDSTFKTFPYITTLGSNTLKDAEADVRTNTEELFNRYDVKTERLLDLEYWPKNCKHCLNYGACQFLPLCKNIRKHELYMRFYRQRELRYEDEHKELKGS